MTITSTTGDRPGDSAFEAFVADGGQLLRRALIARYGLDVGLDLHADALERAWRDWARIGAMANPSGYLWRTAESGHRRYRRWSRRPAFPGSTALADPGLADRDLFLSLGVLSEPERVAVVMVHAHRATYQEVAELLDVPTTTVTNLIHRGLAKLRNDLQETP